MAALMLPMKPAYQLGVLGTLFVARWIGNQHLKGLGVCSAMLLLALLCALCAVLLQLPEKKVEIEPRADGLPLLKAAFAAVGYASMNMMLAMGVVCKSAEQTDSAAKTSVWFGMLMGLLLLLSHSVYSRAPVSGTTLFPMIGLLARFGQKGFYFSGILLYLSIVTTLASVLYALRTNAASHMACPKLSWIVWAGLPLAVSRMGFAAIVDRIYVPAGLFCLCFVFAPMLIDLMNRRQLFLDNFR